MNIAKMGFVLQLKMLLWKNYTLKKRRPVGLYSVFCSKIYLICNTFYWATYEVFDGHQIHPQFFYFLLVCGSVRDVDTFSSIHGFNGYSLETTAFSYR